MVPECASEVECVLAIIVSTGADALRLIFRRDRLVGEYRLITGPHLFCGLLLPAAFVDCIREHPFLFSLVVDVRWLYVCCSCWCRSV